MYNCVFCVVFLENELNLKYSDYHIYSKKKKTYWDFGTGSFRLLNK